MDISRFEESEKILVKKCAVNADEIRALTRKCEPSFEKLEQTTKTLNDALMKLSHRLVIHPKLYSVNKCK